jgi:hypothetical protein
MSGSLRYGTPTDDAFHVKENMSCDIEGRRTYTDAYSEIKASIKSFQKFTANIQIKRNVSFAT